jgi:predicted nucleotidyltransferase
LNENQVEYLLIGGYAVSYHGYPRATGDMDIWVAMRSENAQKIVAALRDFGFNLPQLTPQMFLRPNNIIRMGVVPFRIEILTSIDGVDFEKCFRERVSDVVDGIEVNIISLENLVLNKSSTGRAKDQNDLDNLL